MWRAAAIVGGIGLAGTFFLAFAFGLLFSGSWALGLGAFFGLPSALALGLGMANAGGKTREIAKQLDSAWTAAATDVARAGHATTPSDLARALGTDLARAEQLHAMLVVESIASSRGEPVLAESSSGRVRIVTHPDARPGSDTTLPPDPRFDALEAKAAEARRSESAEDEARAEAESDAARARERAGRT